MTDCDRLAEAFSERLDGGAADDAELDAHLARCAGCRARVREMEEMRRLLRSLEGVPVRPSAHIAREVLAAVGSPVEIGEERGPGSAPAPRTEGNRRRRLPPALVGAAAGTLLALPLAWFAARSLREDAPSRPGPGVAQENPGDIDTARQPALPGPSNRRPRTPKSPEAPLPEDPPAAEEPSAPALPARETPVSPPPPLPLGLADGPAAPEPAQPQPLPPQDTPSVDPRPLRPAGPLEGKDEFVESLAGTLKFDTADTDLIEALQALAEGFPGEATVTQEPLEFSTRVMMTWEGADSTKVNSAVRKIRQILDVRKAAVANLSWSEARR